MITCSDNKHKENIEYKSLNFVITDKTVYHTTHWRVEAENDTYFVQCQEGDRDETWYIESYENGPIDTGIELGRELIEICEWYEDLGKGKKHICAFI